MTLNVKILITVVLFAVVCWSCEFNPVGDNYQKRIVPSSEKIDLTNIASGDTMFIAKVQNFTVSLTDLGSRKVYGTKVTAGGKTIQSYLRPPNSVSFSIYPFDLKTGVYDLKVSFVVSSGSNSLGDLVGNEQITKERSWKIEFDTDAPTKLSITDIRLVDGALRTSWTKYRRKNFSKYRVESSCCISKDITDKNRTYFSDTTFVGGKRQTRVFAYITDNSYSISDYVDYVDNDEVKLQIKRIGNDFLLTWNKSRYFRAFQAYLLTEPPPNNGALYSLINKKDRINDTTFLYSPKRIPIGEIIPLQLTIVGNSYNVNSGAWLGSFPNKQTLVYQGTRYKNSHGVKRYVQGNNSIYTSTESDRLSLYRLDATTLDTLAYTRSVNDIVVSKNLLHSYSVVGSNIVSISANDLTISSLSPLVPILGPINSFITLRGVSDNNLVCIEMGSKTFVINMNIKTKVFEASGADYNSGISQDGRLVAVGNQIFGQSGSTFTRIFDLSSTPAKIYFNANLVDQVVIAFTNDRKIQIMNPWTNTLIREIVTRDNNSNLMIDESTNLALHGSGSRIKVIYDLTNGQTKADLGPLNDYDFYGARTTIFNGRLFRNGLLIEVKDVQSPN